jgi:hypothetical protein
MRRLASLGIGACIIGASLAATSPAQAIPTRCSTWYHSDGQGAASYCASGTGQHRIVVKCDFNNVSDDYRYGNWEVPGYVSNVRCAHWTGISGRAMIQRIDLRD